MPLILESFGLSDIGDFRPNNEDLIASLPEKHFFAIADGMGGHKAGEIAAKEAVQELLESLIDHLHPQKILTPKKVKEHLFKAIHNANKRVFTLGKENSSFRGMGTTLCCLYVHKSFVSFANVGDSRIYLLRNKRLLQLTVDHSLAVKLKKQNQLKENETLPLHYKNIITKAIGIASNIKPSINHINILKNDLFFMCTDGLSDHLPEQHIVDILISTYSKKEAVKKLIEAAKKRGSRDNVTALLIEVKDAQ